MAERIRAQNSWFDLGTHLAPEKVAGGIVLNDEEICAFGLTREITVFVTIRSQGG
jgi:hypothetical protein